MSLVARADMRDEAAQAKVAAVERLFTGCQDRPQKP